MANPFLGEIRMFAGNFAPKNWYLCQGQLIPISQNTALFSLLGTNYGGDGRSTFALPDFRSRAPMHWGQGAGLSPYVIGQSGGQETVTLTTSQLPAHVHPIGASSAAATTGTASATVALGLATASVYGAAANLAPMAAPAGGSQPHENQQPYLVLNFIIAAQGIFPARN